jgi:DNA-binding HxlR family transcriptional regulator
MVGTNIMQMEPDNTDNQSFTVSERIAKVFAGNCRQKNSCPVKDVLARFGDKWSMYTVLRLGQHEKRRFNELKQGINGISQRMLTVTLRSLEEDGVVLRKVYPEILPPRVEYELTELGKSLLEQLLQLANWADDHFEVIVKARKNYIKKHRLK